MEGRLSNLVILCDLSHLGYHGLYCEEEYNECLSAPCQNYATCKDLINAYECVCTPQFEGKCVRVFMTLVMLMAAVIMYASLQLFECGISLYIII